jgi:hypothetical protein
MAPQTKRGQLEMLIPEEEVRKSFPGTPLRYPETLIRSILAQLISMPLARADVQSHDFLA